jgi:hypothetical protein
MQDLVAEMEADVGSVASAVESIDGKGLKSIAEIARAVRDKEVEVAALEQTLKAEKKALLKLTDEDLPAMLQEIGLASLELDDGSKVTVRPTYGAHIKIDNREQAYEWLRQHEFGDLIKNTVSCNFGRGEDQQATDFCDFAEQQGFVAEQKTEIHSSTLKAWVREQVESGNEFPMELFGAFVGQRATIKRGK